MKRKMNLWKYLILLVFSFIFLYPIFLMFTSSFKSNTEIISFPLKLPNKLSLDNFISVWNEVNFGDYLWNSVFVSVVSIVVILIVSSLAAFYLARFNFKWNGPLLFFFMVGLMLPMKLAVLPMYMLMMKLHLVNTLYSLIIIYIAGKIPLAVFILYGFFRTVPKELELSAQIDGCSNFQVYYKIILPLMRPALATVAIVDLLDIWNDFFYPLIFIRDEALKTIPLGMQSLFGEFHTEWNLLFAGLALSSLPMIIAFLFASKQFIEGIASGALK